MDEFALETPRGFGGPGGPGTRFPGPMSPFAISADLRTVATLQHDGTARMLNTVTRETNLFRAVEPPISIFALSPDGRTLVAGKWQSGINWWDLRRGTNTLTESQGGRALFSGDSRTLAIFSREGSIELWDVPSRSLRTNMTVDPAPNLGGTSGLAAGFSPDNNLLAVACQDDGIRLWDMRTTQLLGVLVGHKQNVYTVAFSPDGKTIATASDDSTLKFWNVATQQELFTIRRLGGGLRALTFSPDGRSLVAGTSSTLLTGGLRVFRAPLFQEIEAEEAINY